MQWKKKKRGKGEFCWGKRKEDVSILGEVIKKQTSRSRTHTDKKMWWSGTRKGGGLFTIQYERKIQDELETSMKESETSHGRGGGKKIEGMTTTLPKSIFDRVN